jgi:ADP-ribose pyrophosphatase YjhB (NUDIX family)
VVRETAEETKLVVKAENIITITNDVFESEQKHYITIWVLCTMTDPKAVPVVRQKSLCLLCKDVTLELMS